MICSKCKEKRKNDNVDNDSFWSIYPGDSIAYNAKGEVIKVSCHHKLRALIERVFLA